MTEPRTRRAFLEALIYAYHEPWIAKTPELYQPATRNLIQGAGKASALT